MDAVNWEMFTKEVAEYESCILEVILHNMQCSALSFFTSLRKK